MDELAGKTALITGASKGIGAAAATHLAGLGVNVVLAARSVDAIEKLADEINASGGNARAIACDVADYSQVQAAVDLCAKTFGSLDILVNNAGLIDPIARIADSDPTSWAKVIEVNVNGVYHGIRAALPLMEKQGSGVIINISSGAATGALEGWSHYCASKAAALSLTRCTYREVADQGIRVVGLSPGTVATDMQVSIKKSGINPVSELDPSVHIPPEWVARAIAFLATDAGCKFDGDDFSLRSEEGRQAIGAA